MSTKNREPLYSNQPHDPRHLWFGSFHGILSTHSSAMPGYPFGSLTPVCRDLHGYPLLLVSHLAQHTQNLLADTHCSLILTEPHHGDIQQWGRLTCLARAEQIRNITTSMKDRYFRYFPASRDYYEKLNFHFYRLIPERFYFIGGFGSARWFDPERLLPAALFSEEDENVILSRLQSQISINGSIENLTLVGIDPLGLDYYANDQLSRFMFKEPVINMSQCIDQLGLIPIFHPDQPN